MQGIVVSVDLESFVISLIYPLINFEQKDPSFALVNSFILLDKLKKMVLYVCTQLFSCPYCTHVVMTS